jgi:protein O-mannosyl-transferase
MSTSRRKRNTIREPKIQTVVDSNPAVTGAGVWLLALLLAAFTFVTFVPALWNQFVDWDDYENLVNNPAYRGLGWNQLRWMFTTFHLGHYQPLSWVTLGIDYLIWGLNPVGYHLTNLILHAANAIFFYFISRRLLSQALSPGEAGRSWQVELSAAFAALLFAVHPLRVESVAWATERRDVLSGFFFLWTIYCYLLAASISQVDSRRRWLYAALVLHGLSLLSKAIAMTVPVVLLLLDIYPLGRLQGGPRNWFKPQFRSVLWEKLPFLSMALVFALSALLAQRSIGALKPLQHYDITSRIGQGFYGIIFYLWKSLLPIRLSPLYELPYDPEPWLPVFAAAAITAIAVSLVVYVLRQRWPALLASWAYYLLMLVPVLGIAQSGPQLVADRYTYLACLSWGLLIAGVLFFYWLPSSGTNRDRQPRFLAAPVISVATVLILAFLTWRQIGVWRDTRTLWEHVIKVAPASSIARYNLGKALESEGRVEQAVELYRRAVELNPGNPDAHHNLARLLARSGQRDEAIGHYRQALAIKPDDADTHNNLGLLLAVRGETEESLRELQQAVQIDPAHARAYFNMGRIFARQGDLDSALVNYQRAVKLNPNEAEIHLGLGNVLSRQGQIETAATHFEQAVRLRPDFPDAHVALARALVAQGKKDEAGKHYEEALRLIKLQGQTPPHVSGASREN